MTGIFIKRGNLDTDMHRERQYEKTQWEEHPEAKKYVPEPGES